MFDIKSFLEANEIFMDLFMTEGGKAKAVVTPLSTSVYVFGKASGKITMFASIERNGQIKTIGSWNNHKELDSLYEKECAREVHIIYNK